MAADRFLADVASLRDQLDQAASALTSVAEQLRLALPLESVSAQQHLDATLHLSTRLRDRLAAAARQAGLELFPWKEVADLDALVTSLADRLRVAVDQSLARLAELARELTAGQLCHRRPGRQQELEALRQAALAELKAACHLETPPWLPPSGNVPWLEHWWHLDGASQEHLLHSLSPHLSHLRDFLNQVEAESWAAPGAVPPGVLAEVAPTRTPEAAATVPVASVAQSQVEIAKVTEEANQVQQAKPAKDHRAVPVRNGQAHRHPVRETPAERACAVIPRSISEAAAVPCPTSISRPPRENGRPPEPVILIETLPPDPPCFPEELAHFNVFRARHWINPGGDCELAPWANVPVFLNRLDAALNEALRTRQFPHVELLARGMESLGGSGLRSADLRALTALWTHPLDSTAGMDRERTQYIDQASDVAPGERWKLILFLEAVRPSSQQGLTREHVESLLDLVPFQSRLLGTVVRGLWHAGLMGIEPVVRLREAFRVASNQNVESLRQQLLQGRQALHDNVRHLWQAAGGGIQRTHCREAWDEFIAFIRPTIEALFPPNKNGQEDWDVDQVRQRIGEFYSQHERLANHRGVRFQDRANGDRAARKIVSLASDVNDLMEQIHRCSGRRPASLETILPLEPARQLLRSKELDDALEECCRQALVRLLDPPTTSEGEASREPLEITATELLQYPEWLGLLEPGFTLDRERARKPPHTLFHIGDIRDPLQACAILLAHPVPVVLLDNDDPFDALMGKLERHPTRDLLGLAGGLGGAARDQGTIHATRSKMADELRALLGQLRELICTLATLGVETQQLRQAEQVAIDLVEQAIASPDLGILREWLVRLVAFAEERRKYEHGVLHSRAQELPETEQREGVLAALESSNYGLAYVLLNLEGSGEPAQFRETCWRHEVEARFGKPDRAARTIHQMPDALGQAWRALQGQVTGADRPMRTALAKYLLSEETLYRQADNDPHYFAIEIRHLRSYLARTQRNPCYLPQLPRMGKLVLLTPPVPFDDRQFRDKTHNLLVQHRGHLCVVLTPKITSQFRREILGWFREHNAVVFDDYDLCRLLNPGASKRPEPLLGFLEIAFEQLRWRDVSPFVADDGQRVPLEIFVGRRKEADAVALTGQYSRLFSGRKLGKSALLNFIRETYEGAILPSGMRLRVVYVPAAGIEDEAALAQAVFHALADRLGYQPTNLVGQTVGDRLVEALLRFPQQCPEESLLIILDEADVFVEAQLREYARVKEKCLSFKIRGQVTSCTDASNLPRVRVLYSGYRATHTREGAWGGSGSDVLFLEPLPPREAEKLIAGPLARLGISAGQQAALIAHRCGCQPIVLLRFGECLLHRLESIHPPAQRDRNPLRVTAEDVDVVFNDPRVRDEIWSVTRGNFQGNELGLVVFLALLLEFAGKSPGSYLEEAEAAVLARLRHLEPDLDWLVEAGDEPMEIIAGHFRDLVDRQLLLRRERAGRVSYTLRFPHHLPVLLLCKNLEREALLALRDLEQGAQQEPSRILLPPSQIRDLHTVLFRPEEYPVAAVVVASHWLDCMADLHHGLPVWLGLLNAAPGAVVSARSADLAGRLNDPYLLVTETTPAIAAEVLSDRRSACAPAIFVGGMDLLRWTLTDQRQGLRALELATTGRLPPAVLRGWFTRVRALEFDVPDALGRITALTSGIPLLVAIFDRLFLLWEHTGGTNISAQTFADTLALFEEERLRVAAELEGTDPAMALSRRERQILFMLHAICKENQFKACNLADEMHLGWELYQEECPVKAFDPTPGGEDMLALELLQRAGLLPVDPDQPAGRTLDRLRMPEQEDGIWMLVEGLRLPR